MPRRVRRWVARLVAVALLVVAVLAVGRYGLPRWPFGPSTTDRSHAPILHEITKLERLTADANPLTRHLTGLAISMETRGPLYLGAACYLGGEITVYPYSPAAIEISGQQWHGGILHTIDTLTIYPQPGGAA